MRIAVINEISAVDKNKDIVSALEGRGHIIINAGMKHKDEKPELTYIHTGLLAAILLNLRRVELVVGGCGTGQGFLNSCMQYPNVFCGLLQNSLDAWLFAQINGGNCISLALNYGYGWAGEVNLKFIFDQFFSFKEFGQGYPPHRAESQRESLKLLREVSMSSHKPFKDIILSLNTKVIGPVLSFPGVWELIDVASIKDKELKEAFERRFQEIGKGE